MNLRCPKCNSQYPKKVWKASKTNIGVSVICPSCQSKFHWNKLKRPTM